MVDEKTPATIQSQEAKETIAPEISWKHRFTAWLRWHYGHVSLIVLLSEIVGICVLIVLICRVSVQHCWPRPLIDPGPITVVQNYFVVKANGSVQPIVVGEYSGPTDDFDKIGVQLELKRQCYCQALYADVVLFKVVSGIWLESKLGGVTLEPAERDGEFALEGPWSPLPPTDRYKVVLYLKCANKPDLPLKKIDFATFKP